MLLQAKNRKGKQFFKKNRKGQFLGKNRKGVSIMVGYVLLVVFAIILSTIAYQWIKTYIPSEPLQCPDDGVSVSIKALSYDCGANTLYLLIKNNGRFNIHGYFAHATNVSGQEVATIDLSQYFQADVSGGQKFGNSIAFISSEQNIFKPGDEKAAIFNLTDVGVLTSIQITPTRMQEVDNKNRFISCGNEKVKQDIYCGMDTRIVDAECVPKTCGVDYECEGPWANGTCGGTITCGACTIPGESCVAGQCEIVELTEGVVFVSSTEQSGDLGGISGADIICNNLAGDAPLEGTFVAWLSNSTLDAKDRIPDIIFKRVDGVVIANNLADLIDGNIQNIINLSEKGLAPDDVHAFTGTDTDGTKASNNCLDWTSGNAGDIHMRGKTDQTNNKWTNEKSNTACDHTSGIYCFQIS